MGDELFYEAFEKFNDCKKDIKFVATQGGINNFVKSVEIRGKTEFVLRIYNNGNDLKRVQFEHYVLQELGKMPLSFKIP